MVGPSAALLAVLSAVGAATGDEPSAVTWHGRIAAIARERCETCHWKGGPGPFELASVDDFSGAAAMIRRRSSPT